MGRGRPKKITEPVVDGQVKKLDGSFNKNGYDYSIIERTDKAAIYKKVNTESSTDIGFEVFSIKIGKAFTLVDKKTKKIYNYPAMEKFPRDEEFGTIAWDFMDLKSAKEKYKTIK